MRPVDQWGPFADGLDPGERLARLRALRVLTHLLCGPTGLTLQARIRKAEAEPTEATLDLVMAGIEDLPSIPRRHLLASYAAIAKSDRVSLGTGRG